MTLRPANNQIRFSTVWLLAITVILLLSLPTASLAQAVKGTFVGTVTDASHAVLPGAKITVTNLETNISVASKTNSVGDYTVPFLDSGQYSVTAEAAGFETSVQKGIELDVAATVRVDFALRVGSSSQRIEVTASNAPLLETDTSNVGTVVPSERLHQLPLLNRNFEQLAELAPSAVQPEVNNPNVNYVPGLTAGNYYQVSGQRGSYTSYTVDGLDNNNIAWQTIAILPSLDTLSEFKIQDHNFSAEYGRGTVQFTAVTKAGTSQFHGSAYEFARNAAFNANSYFNNRAHVRKTPFTYNQFGVTLGGPILIPKLYNGHKSFFFFGFEGTRYATAGATFTNWPNPAWLTGDFSSLGVPIYDPATTQPDPNNPGQYIRSQFPGNIIPTNRFDSVAVASIPYIPKPGTVTTVPGENTEVNTHTVSSPNNYAVRLDQTFSQKDSVYGTWRRSNEYETIAGIAPLSGTIGVHDGWSVLGAETHIFSDHLVNEFRAGYLDSSVGSYQEGGTGGCVGPCPANTNLVSAFGIHNLVGATDSALYGMPYFSWTGYSAMGGGANNPLASVVKTLQLSDNLVLTHGKHTFKMGANWGRENFTYTSETYARGGFNFSGQFTQGTEAGQTHSGSPWADYLLGLGTSDFGLSGSISGGRLTGFQGYYFQDDWRIASNLTLNLGLRWEYFNPFVATANGENAQFNLGMTPGSCFGPGCPAGFIQEFNKGQAFYPRNWNDWGPRVGFAYSPKGIHGPVIRSSYGIFYTPTDSTDSGTFGLFNPPASFSFTETPQNQYTDLTTTKVSNQFPATGIVPPVSQLTTANWPLPPITIYSDFIPSMKDASVQEWHLSVQQAIGQNMIAEVGYLGSHGVHGSMDINYNQARLDNPGVTTTIISRMPYPSLSSTMIFCIHESINSYNAGYARFERRLAGGLSFTSAYTWAKAESNYSNKNDAGSFWVQNSYNPKGDFGLSDFDAKNRFSAGYVYQLPFGKGRQFGRRMNPFLDAMAGGWQWSGITIFQTGNPLFPSDATDQSNTGMFTGIRPNQVAKVHYMDIRKTGLWFDPSAFQYQPFGTFGNAPKGALYAPGNEQWDMGFDKSFNLADRASIQFRTEMFNAFNHAQFVKTGVTISPTLKPTQEAGVSSTLPPRNIEFALRIDF